MMSTPSHQSGLASGPVPGKSAHTKGLASVRHLAGSPEAIRIVRIFIASETRRAAEGKHIAEMQALKQSPARPQSPYRGARSSGAPRFNSSYGPMS